MLEVRSNTYDFKRAFSGNESVRSQFLIDFIENGDFNVVSLEVKAGNPYIQVGESPTGVRDLDFSKKIKVTHQRTGTELILNQDKDTTDLFHLAEEIKEIHPPNSPREDLAAPGQDMEALERYREKFPNDPNGRRIEHLILDIIDNKEILDYVIALGRDGDLKASLLGSAAPKNPIYLNNFFLDLFPGLESKITVYDIDEGAVAKHRELVEEKKMDDEIQVQQADLMQMEPIFPPQKIVISDYVINFMPDLVGWDKHCKLMSESIVKGGVAFFSVLTDSTSVDDELRTIIVDPSTGDTRTVLNRKSIESLLDDAGFDIIEFGQEESGRWTEAVHIEDLDFFKEKHLLGEPEKLTYVRYFLKKR